MKFENVLKVLEHDTFRVYNIKVKNWILKVSFYVNLYLEAKDLQNFDNPFRYLKKFLFFFNNKDTFIKV